MSRGEPVPAHSCLKESDFDDVDHKASDYALRFLTEVDAAIEPGDDWPATETKLENIFDIIIGHTGKSYDSEHPQDLFWEMQAILQIADHSREMEDAFKSRRSLFDTAGTKEDNRLKMMLARITRVIALCEAYRYIQQLKTEKNQESNSN